MGSVLGSVRTSACEETMPRWEGVKGNVKRCLIDGQHGGQECLNLQSGLKAVRGPHQLRWAMSLSVRGWRGQKARTIFWRVR